MTLENWLSVGKLKKHATSKEEISALFTVVERDLKDASLKGLSNDRRFTISYNAAFQAALALIFCNGYKPSGEAHHFMAWQALKDILPKDKLELVNYFDGCRKKRNISDYDMAGVISQKEADELHKESRSFVTFIKEEIRKILPNHK